MSSRSLKNVSAVSPRLSRSDKIRIEIIDAAIDEIAQNGIEATGPESVGKRLKMSRSHVSYYFKSRDELILKAIETVILRAQAHTVQHLSGIGAWKECICGMFDAACDWVLAHRKEASVLLLLQYYAQRKGSPLRKIQTLTRLTGRSRIAQYLELGADRAELKLRPADRGRVATAIHALMQGRIVDLLTVDEETELTADEIQREMRRTILQLLGTAH